MSVWPIAGDGAASDADGPVAPGAEDELPVGVAATSWLADADADASGLGLGEPRLSPQPTRPRRPANATA